VSRILVPLLAVLTVAALGAANAAGSPPQSGRDVAIFYYPWYGTPAADGVWQHWQQNGFTPPTAIASNWYPARGPYSSSDPVVVRRQMREIAAAGVRTVVVSWWGPGSVEAARFPFVARMARAAGLRVAAHVEPYAGRTPAALESDLRPLLDAGVTDYYVYDSTTSPDPEWRQLNARYAGMRLFANTGLVGKALAGGFAGLYTYDVYTYDGSSFPRICAAARSRRLICAPSVGPGYDASRATGDPRTRSRAMGATYDRMWRAAIRASADIVTITSYNEWHEGTQIEPARAVGAPYASYDGAYGLVGRQAEGAYLGRTAEWVRRYDAMNQGTR
jgi:glycoprotein endo-alpha-1,2-mannosidase